MQRVQPQARRRAGPPRIRSNSPVPSSSRYGLPVEQEHLAGHHRQQRVVLAAEPVAPPGQHLAEAADLTVHPVAAEDPPGQGEAAEAAELAEGGEAADKEGVRRQVGTHRVICPAGSGLAEAVLVAAEQAGPFLIGPCPVRPASFCAPQQHHRGRIEHRPAAMRGGRRFQRGTGVIQRPQQPPDRLPPSGGPVVAGQAAQVIHAETGNGRPPQRPAPPAWCHSCPGRPASASARHRLLPAPPAARSPGHLRHLAGGGEHPDPPGVDVLHATGELAGQVTAGQVNVPKRGISVAMPRRTPRSRALPSPSAPGRSGTDAAGLWVENCGTPASSAIWRTTFDQVHKVSGWA